MSHDSQTEVWKIPSVLAQAGSENRTTSESGNVLDPSGGGTPRATGADVQAPRIDESGAGLMGPAPVRTTGMRLYLFDAAASGAVVNGSDARRVSQSRRSTPPLSLGSTVTVNRSTGCGSVLSCMSIV